MDDSHSDALVFFGATGDLAYKEIFPALQALVKRRKQHLVLPAVQLLLDTLNRTVFRRELEGLGGYDTTGAGKQVA